LHTILEAGQEVEWMINGRFHGCLMGFNGTSMGFHGISWDFDFMAHFVFWIWISWVMWYGKPQKKHQSPIEDDD